MIKMPYNIEARIKTLRLIDDIFFACVFDDNPRDMEFVLRIIMNRPTLRVLKMIAQKDVANIFGRSVIFDIFAVDDLGQNFNIEVQRDAPNASPRRARYNSSMMDFMSFKKSIAFKDLPESYVIMITETDVLKMGKPLYIIDRYICEGDEPPVAFGDGSHIIYVNGAIHDDTPLGKLMHDFFCTNPADMHYKNLAELTHYFKTDKGGIQAMSNLSYEIFREGQTLGTDNAILTTLKNVIINAKTTVEDAMNIMGIPDDKRTYYAELLAKA